jgi:hypothetical protein
MGWSRLFPVPCSLGWRGKEEGIPCYEFIPVQGTDYRSD